MSHESDPEEASDEPDDLPFKNLGAIAMIDFEHDDFIDGLDRSIKYPEDAP